MCQSVSYFVVIFLTLFAQAYCFYYIDNFQENSTVSGWVEHSDTVKMEGKSKSSFVLHETGVFRRAVLFTMLNPQSCGAALAGIRKSVGLDIHKYKSISLKIRGQGQYRGYDFFLRHKKSIGIESLSYVQRFQAPSEFEIVHLLIKDFQPYLRGKLVEGAKPLNKSHIATLGIVAVGGAHQPKQQHGVASLEIDWIRLE